MASFQERLKDLTVTVTSPDGQIKARIESGENLTIGFRPGCYEGYRDEVLEQQLVGLGKLAWVGYRRGYMKALNLSRGLAEDEQQRPHWNAKYRRYHDDIAVLVAGGKSPSERIQLRAKGLADWKVKIAPGTVNALDEEMFVNETLSAFHKLQRDWKQKIVLLKDEHFGLNIPDFIRKKYQN